MPTILHSNVIQQKGKSSPRNLNIEKNKQWSFSSECFKQSRYLEYSLESNKAYCFVCQLFPQSDLKADLIKSGLNTRDKMKNVGHHLAVVARNFELHSNLCVERLVEIEDINDKTSDEEAQGIVVSVDRSFG